MKKFLAFLLVTAMLLLGGWYVVSPHLTFRALRDAAREGDAARIDKFVDLAAVKGNLKTDLQGVLRGRVETPDDPLAQLGLAAGALLIDQAVDAFVSAEGIGLVSRGKRPDRPESTQQTPSDDYTIDRQGVNTFAVRFPREDGTESPLLLIFSRRGLSWELTRITLGKEE